MSPRRILTVLLTLAVGALPGLARADFNDPSRQGPLHPMVFPVLGNVSYGDSFLAPRSGGRQHQGQDVMGQKMQPLVAAAEGTVTNLTIPQASYGYMLSITDDEGWRYNYLHINNDTPGTDDGLASLEFVFAPGIEEGARVAAGQHVAFLGDSGNAESTGPHLHFELVDPTGVTVNAFASLNAATRLAAPAPAPPGLPRLAGPDRVGTAVEASKAGWPGGSPHAVLAAGDRYAEALPASVLAAQLGAPLLLADVTGVTDPVLTELQRLGAGRVTVVGSVPAGVDALLEGRGLAVERIAGGDKYQTAAALAERVGARDGVAVLVNAERFADGISAAGLAAGRGWPILLSGERTIPQVIVDTWRDLGVERVYLVGGPVVLSSSIEHFVPDGVRLWGEDRYGTSVAALEQGLELGGPNLATTWLATGTNYPDALTAGALAARTQGALLLVDGSGSRGDTSSRSFLSERTGQVRVAAVLGGTKAVSGSASSTLARLLGI